MLLQIVVTLWQNFKKEVRNVFMKKLTDKELAIMEVLWEHGELSIRDLISFLPGPAAHFNTIATYVRRLEMHGMIRHKELSAKFYLYDARSEEHT